MNTILLVAAIVAGWLASGLLLAMLIGPQMRRSAAGLSSDLDSVARRPEARPVAPKAAAAAWRRHGRWTVSAGFAAAAFAGSTGLAAAGALPQPVQGVAHSVLRSVGVSVPEISGEGPGREPTPVALDDSPDTTDDLRPSRNPAVVAATRQQAERQRVTTTSTTVGSSGASGEDAEVASESKAAGVASVPTSAPAKTSTTRSSTVPTTTPTTAGPAEPVLTAPPPTVLPPETTLPPPPDAPPTEEPPVDPVPEPPAGGPGQGPGTTGNPVGSGPPPEEAGS